MKELSQGDIQKLLRIALNDLTIRRTLLENELSAEQADLRTLEQSENIERLDRQIMTIQRDYDYYRQFLDPAYNQAAD